MFESCLRNLVKKEIPMSIMAAGISFLYVPYLFGWIVSSERFLPASLPTRGLHLEYCRVLLRPDSRGGVEGMADDGEGFC